MNYYSSVLVNMFMYGGPGKRMQILLSSTQAGPGRTVNQEQEEISPNHMQRLNLISVCINVSYRVIHAVVGWVNLNVECFTLFTQSTWAAWILAEAARSMGKKVE